MQDWSFCPTLREMLETGRTVGEGGKEYTALGALSTRNNLAVLREFMRKHRPAASLEVGLSYGGSCLAIAASHKEFSAPARQHVACDPYQRLWHNAGLLALDRAGLSNYVDFRESASSLVLPRLLEEKRQFGLIYIDGSHFFDDVFVDFYYAIRLVTSGGVVFLDDSTTDHVAKVLRFVRTNWRGWVEEVDVAPYHPAGQSLRYRLAKRLAKVQMTAFRRTGDDPREWDAPLVRF